MSIKEYLGAVLTGVLATLLTQNATEDLCFNVKKDIAAATQSNSYTKSLLGAAAIISIGIVVGTKGVSLAVRKVRGI